jgi:hypothetical protein
MHEHHVNGSNVLSTAAMCRILGTKYPVPLTPRDMASSLRVTFFPGDCKSQKLADFLQRFRLSLLAAGVEVLSYDQALAEGHDDRIGEGIVLIAAGEGEPGNLAIDHVSSLSKNTVLGILHGALPGAGQSSLQTRVNALVGALVWHMVHTVIYVDDSTWTVCNMNGAINTFSLNNLEERVLDTLIPKLAAPVVPPQRGEYEVRDNAFDTTAPTYKLPVEGLLTGAHIWGKTGLLASHTKLSDLAFRNNKYRRIASAFLNWRTGMSYGFLAHQLPTATYPAIDLDEAGAALRAITWTDKDFYDVDNHTCVAVKLRDKRFLVSIPEVSVLCTRSGCEKTRPDPARDLVKLTLRQGRIIVGMPNGLGEEVDCQPSFDTISILANAVGNAIVGSILAKINPHSRFRAALNHSGMALAHWHGYLLSSELPPGYYFHGQMNPPVCCSTPQAAIFALAGKLTALQQSIQDGVEYLGDFHEEPSHGTNATGRSLMDLVQLVVGARP